MPDERSQQGAAQHEVHCLNRRAPAEFFKKEPCFQSVLGEMDQQRSIKKPIYANQWLKAGNFSQDQQDFSGLIVDET